MEGYLGEQIVDISKDENYKHYTTNDWILEFISSYGQIYGDHHKLWVLDQIARIAHGTPIILKLASWENGYSEYRFSVDENVSIAYTEWVKTMRGEEVDGEHEYFYDEGVAP